MRKTVLVADDNASSREFIREALATEGWRVLEAADGSEALRRILEIIPDLVLLDIQMPPPDGYAVLRALRADSRCAGMRVVALTAFAMRSDRDRALAAGFDGYISKPVHARTLREQVAALLAGTAVEEHA